jgi:tocopherol O-methyltransferase
MNEGQPPAQKRALVGRYYDKNTARFLRFGGSGQTAAIHRQIWAPGVEDAEQAFLYLNREIARVMQPALEAAPVNREEAHLVDLGCGVGGTATWLAQQLHLQVSGVSNSHVQIQIALQRAHQEGLEGRCRFFATASRLLAKGGRLALCDDFLAESAAGNHHAEAWIRRFKKGWQILSLAPVAIVQTLAAQAGLRLIQAVNLSAYTRSFSPFVYAVMKLVTRLPFRTAYWENLAGGTALQTCLQNGWTEYHSLVWEIT